MPLHVPEKALKGFLRVLSQNVVIKLLLRTCVTLRNSVEGPGVTVRVCLPPNCCDLSEIPQIIPLTVVGLLLAYRALTPSLQLITVTPQQKDLTKTKKLKF